LAISPKVSMLPAGARQAGIVDRDRIKYVR
jgi:hypothetical protein